MCAHNRRRKGNHMQKNEILTAMNRLRDAEYGIFQAKLIPHLPPEMFLGVRTPDLRQLAKALAGTDAAAQFLQTLPHHYFDENQLHAFLVSRQKDFDICIAQTEAFLPYVDNWATCDQFSPAVFGRQKDRLLPYLRKWMQSPETYTLRFAVGMLMRHFLDDRFAPEYPEAVAQLRSEEYYINMEIAWYFATALAKQYDAVLPYLEQNRLETWTHNKAIQKSIESRRITDEQKAYLRTLKR